MKRIWFVIVLTISSIMLFSCEKVNIPDVPDYDKTEILSLILYDKDKENVIVGDPSIDTELGLISVTIAPGTDLKNIFAVGGLSSGATINPSLGGYQDWSSQSREFVVTSASGTREKKWTITLSFAN